MKFETIGQAIDYLIQNRNRRVECRIEYPNQGHKNQMLRYTNRLEFLSMEWISKDEKVSLVGSFAGNPREYPTSGWAPCGANWFELERASGFFSTRESPPAPAGFQWTQEANLTLVLEEDGTLKTESPIVDTRERDIQAARVAEFDSRPEG